MDNASVQLAVTKCKSLVYESSAGASSSCYVRGNCIHKHGHHVWAKSYRANNKPEALKTGMQ